jgi:protoporphyrin/coproporphyrin ferrochelatase
MTKPALVLVNIGSPKSPNEDDVREYLREFLSDPRVIDINAVGRWALLNFVILPFRPAKSAAAYQKIWTAEGSPLVVFTKKQAEGLQQRMPGWDVHWAMRYGEPNLASVVPKLKDAPKVVLVPLYPQYSLAATESSRERFAQLMGKQQFTSLPAFYGEPDFIDAFAARIDDTRKGFDYDHVLFSYHGLPERQVKACEASAGHCFRPGCCDKIVEANFRCYRAHCFATSRLLTERLGLDPQKVTTSFQSRLGRTPWIQPFTDVVLDELPRAGVKRLLVACPSFVTDCLETLEEVGIRAAEQFKAAGGEALVLTPCLNDDPRWLDGMARMLSTDAL